MKTTKNALHRYLLPLLAVLHIREAIALENPHQQSLLGYWQAGVETAGGHLPFYLNFFEENGSVQAKLLNDKTQLSIAKAQQQGNQITLVFSGPGTEITAIRADEKGRASLDGQWLMGRWTRINSDRRINMPFSGQRITAWPVRVAQAPKTSKTSDEWVLRSPDNIFIGYLNLKRQGARISAALIAGTDNRYYPLAGTYSKRNLELSWFDGDNAILIKTHNIDKRTLAGDLWWNDRQIRWTAKRMDKDQILQTAPLRPKMMNISAYDLHKKRITLTSADFAGCVVLLNIFGSWCPSCHEESAMLANWQRRYANLQFKVVSLAFELSSNTDENLETLQQFAAKYHPDFTMLLGGSVEEAVEKLAPLIRLNAYPTNVFIDRSGQIRGVYPGFIGAAQHQQHQHFIGMHERILKELLAEPLPASSSCRLDSLGLVTGFE